MSIYSFNVNSAAVSVDIFYIKDRPKSTHQSSKVWKRVRLSTSTLWAYNKWIDFLKLSAHMKCWYLFTFVIVMKLPGEMPEGNVWAIMHISDRVFLKSDNDMFNIKEI